MILKTLFSRQWWPATLLVLAAIAVMIRLGIWQLDRLDERRAFNARVNAQIAAPLLTLNADALNQNLTEMEYRQVVVVGEYDHSQEVGLRNQVRDGQLGVHLLTPLVVEGTEAAVLVNRGWVPADAPDWDKFAEPGRVEVRGIIRASQTEPDFGGIPDPEGELRLWNLVNVGRIDAQVSHALLPIYIQQAPPVGQIGNLPYRQQAPDVGQVGNLPYRTHPQLDLSEGSHFGYAMQWFLFAAVLGIGYPFYVRDTQRRAGRKKAEN